MGKTLAIILNHNLPEYTDSLYTSLMESKNDNFDLFVMDNGSKPELKSKFTNIHLPINVFWGGALNKAFKMLLDKPEYDSLLFMNNDIEINGSCFISKLRQELFDNDLAIVTPCIAGKANPWRQMQNWGSKKTRIVKWIDNQAPLFHRKIIEEISQFDDRLIYGWGQELVCYFTCSKKNWNIGVCDFLTMIHYAKQTFKNEKLYSLDMESYDYNKTKEAVSYEDFTEKARNAWMNHFEDEKDKFKSLVNYGHSYNQDDIVTV